MADEYCNFGELSQHETSGVGFGIRLARAAASFAIVAPHGGGIEPGTSELAEAVAGERLSFYSFEGLKSSGNAVLHITSTRFDEPMCGTLLAESERVITIHGERSELEGAGVFLGGIDVTLGARIRKALEAKQFDVLRHSDPDLQGLEPSNLCNRGKRAAGVQLELSRSVRETMFESLSRAGREHVTDRFHDFVTALVTALAHDERALPQLRYPVASSTG